MKRLILPSLIPLAACADLTLFSQGGDGSRRPTPRPSVEAQVPEDASTVEEFDITSDAERAAAIAASSAAADGVALGTTIASLGDPAQSGFWLKTPLVTEITQGRLVYAESGVTVRVELRPSGTAPGGGSQISLAAMRLLRVPLTSLPELSVFADPGT